MRLYFSSGCPFAHRTRALLTHLDQPFEAREINLSAKPPDFLALSPTGRVPLFQEEDFLLYESAIINEYLADTLDWREGVGVTARTRARQRLAMTQFDAVVVPTFFRLLKDPDLASGEAIAPARRELDELAQTFQGLAPASLLGFHLATFWLRWNWVEPRSALVLHARKHLELGAWLDAAAELPAVRVTSPDQDLTVKELRAKFG
jgi:glutathione S-transferase